MKTFRLPFRISLKFDADTENEAAAIQTISKTSEISSPRILDQISSRKLIVLAELKGKSLEETSHILTDEDISQLVEDLKLLHMQLRKIPATETICGAAGDKLPCLKHSGPFENETLFNEYLLSRVGRKRRGSFAFKNNHATYFTHGRIKQQNIIMNGKRFAGLKSWESAGYYPEYWEKVTSVRYNYYQEWAELSDRIFGRYEKEMKIIDRMFMLDI